MMTLEEAIRHAEQTAASCDGECADDHWQLAEWLKELRQWKELVDGIDLRPESIMKPLQPNVNDLERENDRLKAENEKLRDLIFDMLVDEERGHNDDDTYYEHVRLAKDLGIGWSR